jgi:hypothetical protein
MESRSKMMMILIIMRHECKRGTIWGGISEREEGIKRMKRIKTKRNRLFSMKELSEL